MTIKKERETDSDSNQQTSTFTKNRKVQTDNTYMKLAEILTKLSFKILLILSVVVIVLLMVLAQTMLGRIEQSKKLVEIEQGQSYYGLISNWEEEVPFFSATMAKMHIKWLIKDPLYLGTYEMPKNPNFLEVMNILQKGSKSAVVKVQIVEGKTSKDLYEKLRNTKGLKIELLNLPTNEIKQALKLAPEMPDVPTELLYNLEGWFAPNTYLYSEGTTDKQILTDLYNRQQHILDIAWENRALNLPYKNKYQALIMASIIEKETGLPDERSEVAGVFVNRLRKGMRLQTDPTIIYGMGERYDGDIRKKDITEKTAYNTYQINGLPPTPIALPSMLAIEAALHPAETESLFFVATGYGGHKFSKNYEEHKQAVQEYLKVIRSKE